MCVHLYLPPPPGGDNTCSTEVIPKILTKPISFNTYFTETLMSKHPVRAHSTGPLYL